MSATATSFLSELVELVIDHVCQFSDAFKRKRTLASIALLSRDLHPRAHLRLFADVKICGTGKRTATSRIHILRDLIHADPHSAFSGLASYINSFEVEMDANGRQSQSTNLMLAIDDGSLTEVVQKLFINDGETIRPGPRSFSLTLGRYKGKHDIFPWERLNAEFQSAFNDLVHNPLLTSLTLAQFSNFPRGLLRNTKIKHLVLNQISLLPGIPLAFSPAEVCSLLESIETDVAFHLVDLFHIPEESEEFAWSSLKTLSIHIGTYDDFHPLVKILDCVTMACNLQILVITLEFFLKELRVPLDLNELPHLHSLVIRHRRPNFVVLEPYRLRNLLRSIHHLFRGSRISPNLQNLEVSIYLGYFAAAEPSLIFEGLDYTSIDQAFLDTRFASLTSLTISFQYFLSVPNEAPFDENKHRMACEAYLHQNMIPAFTASRKLLLDFDIHLTA